MTKNPKVISKGMLAVEALNMMESHKITALVVTNDESHPIGIVHLHDLLRSGVV